MKDNDKRYKDIIMLFKRITRSTRSYNTKLTIVRSAKWSSSARVDIDRYLTEKHNDLEVQ